MFHGEIKCMSFKNMRLRRRCSTFLYFCSEKDIDEVLQTHTVFANVSKGQVAKKEDLIKAFGTDNQTEICKEILQKGELQVSDKERHNQIDQGFKEIATMVADMCINPELKMPYPVTVIQKSMKDVHYSVKLNQNVKQQALQVIKLLKESIPIERAQLRVRIVLPSKFGRKIKDKITKVKSIEIEKENTDDDQINMQFLIDPGDFKEVEKVVQAESKGAALMEVLSYKEIKLEEER